MQAPQSTINSKEAIVEVSVRFTQHHSRCQRGPAQTGGQLQQVHKSRSNQYRGDAHCAGPPSGGRLDDMAQPEGCVLCNSHPPEISRIVQKLSIPVPSIWPMNGFHQGLASVIGLLRELGISTGDCVSGICGRFHGAATTDEVVTDTERSTAAIVEAPSISESAGKLIAISCDSGHSLPQSSATEAQATSGCRLRQLDDHLAIRSRVVDKHLGN